MEFDLPEALRRAIAPLIEGQGGLSAGAETLSAHYRAGGRSNAEISLAAYLAARLPATYAAVMRVLAELRRVVPDFDPVSLRDAGAGPGTASWAALALWPRLGHVELVDCNPQFLALARTLAAAAPHPALAGAAFTPATLAEAPPHQASLVVAAYVLAELDDASRWQAVDALWTGTSGCLALVEPGTPAGFSRILEARTLLLSRGANILAPCTHEAPCPMKAPDWCHFSVRLPRRRAHLHAKKASLPFEDEKFSYLVAARFEGRTLAARIVAPPREMKHGIRLSLCGEGGLCEVTVPRRDRETFRRLRKLGWGDSVDIEGGNDP